ncbi:MAG: twin-arginine translocase subunit TatC, partial [Alphaproteobacteria bacterium]|nr:twin-arginine translocase subunit TatC [Alphaproteobacteria bacterium]
LLLYEISILSVALIERKRKEREDAEEAEEEAFGSDLPSA